MDASNIFLFVFFAHYQLKLHLYYHIFILFQIYKKIFLCFEEKILMSFFVTKFFLFVMVSLTIITFFVYSFHTKKAGDSWSLKSLFKKNYYILYCISLFITTFNVE